MNVLFFYAFGISVFSNCLRAAKRQRTSESMALFPQSRRPWNPETCLCYRHFSNHFVKKNCHRHRLICIMNPFSIILLASQSTTNVSEAERERLNTKTPIMKQMKQMKQFIVTIRIYILVELKLMLQAYIKTQVFQANNVGIWVDISKI